MAVDITLLFRASVKTVKTRNKALGVAVGGGVEGSRDELFRRSPRPKGDFSSRAREVVSWLLWKRRAGEGGRGPQTALSVSGRAVCQRRAWGRWYEEGSGRVGPGELTPVLGNEQSWVFPGAQTVKRLPSMREHSGSIPGLGRSPGERKMATHSSTLAWKVPWTEERAW